MIRTKDIMAKPYVASGRRKHEVRTCADNAPQPFAQELAEYGSIPETELKAVRSFFEICAGCERHMKSIRPDAGSIVVDSKLESDMEISQQNSSITIEPDEYRKLVIVDAALGDINITMPDPATCENKEIVVKKSSSDDTTHVVNILPNSFEKFDDDQLYDSMQLTDAGDKLHFVSDGINWQIWGGRF